MAMAEKKTRSRKGSLVNTKQEMLESYNVILKDLEEEKGIKLKPEEKIEEKRVKEIVKTAETVSSEGVMKGINNLKMEIAGMFAQLSEKLEDEVNKYKKVQGAVEVKEKELQEIYEIEKTADSLSALIEAQHLKLEEFETEMAAKKEELTREIETARQQWTEEKKLYEVKIKERDTEEVKRREREKEEFKYTSSREQQLLKDKFEDEKAKLERQIQLKREESERQLIEREKTITEREKELEELRKKAAFFPKDMEAALAKAVKETTDRIRLEESNRQQMFKKEFDGEKNVFIARQESLERVNKEQAEHIAKLSQALEKAYEKVQNIAVKTVEGSSNLKTFVAMQAREEKGGKAES